MKYRVSNVAAFHQWERDADAEPEEAERLVRSILGLEPPSAAMQAGTAFHAVLEQATPGLEADRIEHGGYVFTFASDFDVEVCPIREVRASKTYMVDGEPICISGQLDAIDGKRVEDHKTTARFDPERYLQGFQWRLYLDIFDAWEFRWNVFEWAMNDEGYEVFAQHRLTQFRYPSMEADCQAVVERFARFARQYVEPWREIEQLA